MIIFFFSKPAAYITHNAFSHPSSLAGGHQRWPSHAREASTPGTGEHFNIQF